MSASVARRALSAIGLGQQNSPAQALKQTPKASPKATPKAAKTPSRSSVRKEEKVIEVEAPVSREVFDRSGVLSAKMGIMPPDATAFGVSGVLEKDIGDVPQEMEAFDEWGVLQSDRGHTPYAHRHEGRGAEASARAIAEFLESHADAELIAGGKVRCNTTGHEIPLDLYWLASHWEGKKYAKAAGRNASQPTNLPPPPKEMPPAAPAQKDSAGLVAGKSRKERRAEMRAGFNQFDLWTMEDVNKITEQKMGEQPPSPRMGASPPLASSPSFARKRKPRKAPPPGLPPVLGLFRALQRQAFSRVEASSANAGEATTLPYGLVAPPMPPAPQSPHPPSSPPVSSVTTEHAGWTEKADVIREHMHSPLEQSDLIASAHEFAELVAAAEEQTAAEATDAQLEEAPSSPPPEEQTLPEPAAAPAPPVKSMKVVELRAALAARGLPTDGLKPVLAARLSEAYAADVDAPSDPAPVSNDLEAPGSRKVGKKAKALSGSITPLREANGRATSLLEKVAPASGRAMRASARLARQDDMRV